jgi:phenylacetyl-CoA:acceptor oxidoreductase subunit 2
MSALQTNWDARAALNFMGGGAGAGLMIATALARPAHPEWLVLAALALIGGGLTAVWTELGKPLRAPHVFFNPFTSWMARESFAAVLLFALGIAALFAPQFLYGAAIVAALFVWCQARMLHGAKGIPAWRAKESVPLIVCTGLAEGAGLLLLATNSAPALALFAAAVIARAFAWARYSASVKSAALENPGRLLRQIGTVAALALALAGMFAAPAAALAGIASLAAGWQLKLALVTRASRKQGFSLPRLPVRGTK